MCINISINETISPRVVIPVASNNTKENSNRSTLATSTHKNTHSAAVRSVLHGKEKVTATLTSANNCYGRSFQVPGRKSEGKNLHTHTYIYVLTVSRRNSVYNSQRANILAFLQKILCAQGIYLFLVTFFGIRFD